MKCRPMLALAIAVVCSAPAHAGWWHHHHHRAVYGYQPVYQAPMYQAPAYQAPAYQAPACYAQAPAGAQSSPWQDLLLQIVGDTLRDRLQRRQTQPGNIISREDEVGPGSSVDLESVRSDIRELRNDLSLRIENANSILQTQGKAIVAIQNDLHTLRDDRKKDQEDVAELLRNIRDEIKNLRPGGNKEKPATPEELTPAPPANPQPANPPPSETDRDGVDRPPFGAEETKATTIDLNAADGAANLVDLLKKRGDVRITVDNSGKATISPR